ncbi:hypothetical protein [Cytobacillus sp. IB215316]|uniref:hypothetical protein n=1 Tax=Cytobacillus sp. IB215316 TaxID=3097354 RepID=UPI002A14FF26|nr:hypothetical protein [Cytobacillus sp. IB215316]MDX8360806.1 hypothetical protein [Cytobacillus sp. IB215316]
MMHRNLLYKSLFEHFSDLMVALIGQFYSFMGQIVKFISLSTKLDKDVDGLTVIGKSICLTTM